MRWEVRQGDVLDRLREMADGSVHCAVTSPPYWALRDYGTATWEGGDPACAHEQPSGSRQGKTGQRADRTFTATRPYRGECLQCGAVRVDGQIGLEASPEAYVARLVEVFAEVRRVLRDDGTLWLNIGDSYNAYNGNRGKSHGENKNHLDIMPRLPQGAGLTAPDLKAKDLVGIPWRLAFALQSDGWYLRSDIIWSKPNPMPESVTDRPTKAHEYVFLMSKSARYWYDAEAIKEPWTCDRDDMREKGVRTGLAYLQQDPVANNSRKGVMPPIGGVKAVGVNGNATYSGNQPEWGAGRNRRTVWTIPTQPYPEAHFATYPEALVEPCIKAGCPEGGVVLDPFSGSGTTGAVAVKLGRSYIGIELNPAYVALSLKRIGLAESPHTYRDDAAKDAPLFTGAAP